jgi:hypothetical protein
MVTSLLKLPLRAVRRLVRLVTGSGATPPPPPRPADRWEARGHERPSMHEDDDGGHDHGHSHDHGHDHGHSHDHGRAPAPAPAPRAPAPAPAPRAPAPAPDDGHDHGHSHDHGHDHGHSHDHGRAPAPAPSAPLRVEVGDTPNPNAMKFTTNRKVVARGSLSFHAATEARKVPLAAALFEVPGVVGIFAVNDFVTVTKDPGADWDPVVAGVTAVLKAQLA